MNNKKKKLANKQQGRESTIKITQKLRNVQRKRKWKFSGKSSREGQIQREPDK